MAFVMKFEREPSLDEVTNAVYSAASAEGAEVTKPVSPSRQSDGRVTHVIGILNYKGFSYEIGWGFDVFKKGEVKKVVAGVEVESNAAFECLETNMVNGIMFFAKPQAVPGTSDVNDDLNFEPSGQTVDFLRKVGGKLKDKIKGVGAIAVTYLPSRNGARVYERL